MKEFVTKLKAQLISEFQVNDRKGVYSYTQKAMAYNSNKLEGSTFTSEQTASLFDTGTVVAEDGFVLRAKDVEEMNGHFKLFNEIVKSLGAPLSPDLIKRFHYQLKAGVFQDYANGYPVGEYKNRANQVSDIVTELPENIPARIESLVSRYNSGNKDLAAIAEFHAEYEKIHPFQDGNGRTGRAIIVKQCLDSSLIPAIVYDDDKELYCHALHKAQVDNECAGLVKLLEKGQNRYYEAVRRFVDL